MTFKLRMAWAMLAALVAARSGAHLPSAMAQTNADAPVQIGNDLQLFTDNFLIGSLRGAELRLHEPQPAETAIVFDKPWEGNVSAYVTVFADGGKFRMFYRGASAPEYARPSALKPGETLVPAHRNFTCYAESADGIVWTRPSLGLVEFNGSRNNNILLDDPDATENFSPFLDLNPQARPDERYKAIAGGSKGLFAYTSADAIHWRRMTPKVVLSDGTFDSLNVAFWDTRRKEYVAFYRDFQKGIRTIRFATSADFLHWTSGEWAEYGDAPHENLYTNAAVSYFRAPQIYLAFPKRYLPDLHLFADDPEHDGVSETVFMSSRDGVHWNRHFMEALVRPGLDPLNWVHRNNMAATGILQTGPAELSIYVSRHYTFPSASLQRMIFRTDGFVSVHAGYDGGDLVTKPLLFAGTKLVLNYSTSAAGSIRWEMLDMQGKPLPGFSLKETRPIVGDEIEHVVSLESASHSGVARGPVCLHFVLRDADLYSLQFRK